MIPPTDLFGRCPGCPTVAEVTRAAMLGQAVPRCAHHEAEAIEADARAAAWDAFTAADDRHAARLEAIQTRHDDEAQARQAARDDDARADWLDGLDPLARSLAAATGAQPPASSTVPLNAPPSAFASLAGFTDADATDNHN